MKIDRSKAKKVPAEPVCLAICLFHISVSFISLLAAGDQRSYTNDIVCFI